MWNSRQAADAPPPQAPPPQVVELGWEMQNAAWVNATLPAQRAAGSLAKRHSPYTPRT